MNAVTPALTGSISDDQLSQWIQRVQCTQTLIDRDRFFGAVPSSLRRTVTTLIRNNNRQALWQELVRRIQTLVPLRKISDRGIWGIGTEPQASPPEQAAVDPTALETISSKTTYRTYVWENRLRLFFPNGIHQNTICSKDGVSQGLERQVALNTLTAAKKHGWLEKVGWGKYKLTKKGLNELGA